MNGPDSRSPLSGGAGRGFVPALAGLTTVALLLALGHLGDKGFWSDEIQTEHISSSWQTLRDRLVGRESNMWSFYILLAAWQHLVGKGEAALRLLPALLGVLAVPAIALWGRRLGGPRVGLMSAALLAVSGTWLQHAQTLRGYSMIILLASLAAWQFMRVIETPRPARLLGLAALAALGIYTHLYFVLLLGAFGLSLLARPLRPLPWRALLAAGAITLLLLLPLLVLQPFGRQLDWVLPLRLSDVARAALYFSGYSWFAVPLLLAAWSGALVAAFRVWRREGRSPALWSWTLPLCAWLVPLLVLCAYSWLVYPALVPRYLAVSLPAGLVLAALAVDQLPSARSRGVAAAALLALSLPGPAQWYRRPPVENWPALVEWVAADGASSDVIVFTPYFHITSYHFYTARRADAAALPEAIETSSGPYEGGGWGPVPPLRGDLAAVWSDRPRVWLLSTGHAEPRRGPSTRAAELRSLLAATHRLEAERDFGRLKLQRWARSDR